LSTGTACPSYMPNASAMLRFVSLLNTIRHLDHYRAPYQKVELEVREGRVQRLDKANELRLAQRHRRDAQELEIVRHHTAQRGNMPAPEACNALRARSRLLMGVSFLSAQCEQTSCYLPSSSPFRALTGERLTHSTRSREAGHSLSLPAVDKYAGAARRNK
jgi:hypothetical protein